MTFLLIALVTPSLALSFPAESDWDAVQIDEADIEDVCGDQTGNAWWDILGTSGDAAAYVYDDGTNLWFRMRLGGSPVSGKKWREFGWGVMLETDWDRTDSKYDFLVYMDGANEQVTLSENTTADHDFTSDIPEVDHASYASPAGTSGASATATGYGRLHHPHHDRVCVRGDLRRLGHPVV